MGNAGGKPHTVPALGLSLAAGREPSELKLRGAGRRVGSWCCTAIKDLWGGLQSVGREVKSFNWNKAG